MLAPNYHYVKTADKESELDRIGKWIDDVQAQPFRHVFLLRLIPVGKRMNRHCLGQ